MWRLDFSLFFALRMKLETFGKNKSRAKQQQTKEVMNLIRLKRNNFAEFKSYEMCCCLYFCTLPDTRVVEMCQKLFKEPSFICLRRVKVI